jgi:hypothetical protein
MTGWSAAPFEARRPAAWLALNAAGAVAFVLCARPLWLTVREGYTFGDGLELLGLTLFFGLGNVVWLIGGAVSVLKTRDWSNVRTPLILLGAWGALVWYHHMRMG